MTMNPIVFVETWMNNQCSSEEDFVTLKQQMEFDSMLSVAEAALHLGAETLLQHVQSNLTTPEQYVLDIVRLRMENRDGLLEHVEEALSICTSKEHRDVHLEGRLRMERGLIRFENGDYEGAESDLTWAETRLKSVSKASRDHDLALLNKAAFHSSRGEDLMALQVYGDISRDGGHAHETIAISRIGASRIHLSLGHQFDAARHAWNAHKHSILSSQTLLALESGSLFIEICLPHIDEKAEPMRIQIEETQPRDAGQELPQLSVALKDIHDVFNWCISNVQQPISGEHRPDLQALVRIALHLDKLDSIEFILAHPDQTDDIQLAALCMTVVQQPERVQTWNQRLSTLSSLMD